jgi:hypothetical protein
LLYSYLRPDKRSAERQVRQYAHRIGADNEFGGGFGVSMRKQKGRPSNVRCIEISEQAEPTAGYRQIVRRSGLELFERVRRILVVQSLKCAMREVREFDERIFGELRSAVPAKSLVTILSAFALIGDGLQPLCTRP